MQQRYFHAPDVQALRYVGNCLYHAPNNIVAPAARRNHVDIVLTSIT